MESIENKDLDLSEFLTSLREILKNPNIRRRTHPVRINYIYSKLSLFSFYYKNIEILNPILKQIKLNIENIKKYPDDIHYLAKLDFYIEHLYNIIRNIDDRPLGNNSEEYYEEQIKVLKSKEDALKKELDNLREDYDKKDSYIKEQIQLSATKELELKKKEEELEKGLCALKQKENELNFIKEQIQQSEIEKEELKKELDAINNMQNRIQMAFIKLKKHTSNLESEKKRLNWMFYIYAVLCIGVLGLLVYFEVDYLSEWKGVDKWIDYLQYYVPIPILGGLLWAFVFQMNRAQRQLMQIANVLHHIDYVEGLMLAIPIVSVDVNSASEKICNILDNLIKNYMNTSDSLSEQSLNSEISKDNINLHKFVGIAKELKEVFK